MALKISEIARLASVSPATVSRVLNGFPNVRKETRDKVLEVIRKNNYRPSAIAHSLKAKQTDTICLMLPNIQNMAYAPITKGVEDVARERGYTVILCNTNSDEETEKQYFDKMKSRMVDGFVITSAMPDHQNIFDLVSEQTPVVLCSRYYPEDLGRIEICSINNHDASYALISEMIAHGYRRIAIALGNEDIFYTTERMRGYQDALKDAGLDFDERLVMHFEKENRDFYRKTLELIDSGLDFDSIFCTSDTKAIYAMRALYERGLKVPEDIGVFGFDNIDISDSVIPPLTTVSQSPYLEGRLAGQCLIEQIEYKRKNGVLPPPRFHEIKPEIIIRKSSK
ncbi:MAG: LacI family DNA-binding transcriptional regulator [Erysipelotrichaceae bacterium]|nr:LacI family DNA-binding transcriptional regulator [Erysipelotrichaceae bacterium]